MTQAQEVFFSGVWSKHQMGHFLYSNISGRCSDYFVPKDFPVSEYALDGALLPPKMDQRQGEAALLHFPGWTILTFWDRSADARGNSCASFVMRGTHNLDDTIDMAKAAFPTVWARFTFPVVHWKIERK